jgi:ATP-dependent Lon protease
LSETIPQPGPGTRLPIISGWSAYPGNSHFWYRDAASHDLHIHCDEIAQRKRGPSAGVAIFLAIVSALRERALPEKWAATGEMALDGRILVVGGIAEKLVAAHRAGITTVLIPSGNRANLADLPEDVLAQLNIIPVTTIDEALAHAFPRERVVKQEIPVKMHDDSDHAERSTDEEKKPGATRRKRAS